MNLQLYDVKQMFSRAIKGNDECLFCEPCDEVIIYETANFRVLADIFPILPGHLMISSKLHFGCSGEIPPEWQGELINLKNMLREVLERASKKCIFYEHGRAGCCIASDSEQGKCEHFHLHGMPLDLSIYETGLMEYPFELRKLDSYGQIFSNFYEYGNYLYFEDAQKNMLFLPVEDKIVEPHLLRSLICNRINKPHLSDWKQYQDVLILQESYNYIFKNKLFGVGL